MTALESEIMLQDRRVESAFKDLRHKKFKENLPFLILSDELPDGQAYSEYPDGHMEIREVYEEKTLLKSKLVHTLTTTEAIDVRAKNGLF